MPSTSPFGRRAFLGGSVAAAASLALPSLARAAVPAPRRHRRFGMPLSPFGGELQYFRMDRGAVGLRLDRCRETAYSLIQSYVPWNVHENVEGTYDFTGKTSPVIVNDHVDQYQIETPDQQVEDGGLTSSVIANTDLLGFLDECAKRLLPVILRPGPFISDEWRAGGIPDWLLLAGEPDLFIYGPDGSSLTPGFPLSPPVSTVTGGGPLYYFSSPSYASPQYLHAANRWLRRFVAAIGPYLATAGGPVVALQVDDESCFFYRFGPFEADYNPHFLKRWYAAGHHPPPTEWSSTTDGPESLRPMLEWQRYKGREIARYLGGLGKTLRAAGAQLPITHELELQLSPPADLAATAAELILTPETYLGGAGPETIGTSELLLQCVRAASRQRVPLWATEMDNGDAALYHLMLGEGVAGGLQFTYTAGVEDGTEGILAPVGRMLRAGGRLLGRAHRHADVAIVMDQSLAHQPYGTDRWGLDRDGRRVIENHVPALAELLVRAGYAFDVIDPAAATPADYERYPTILLASADSLARSAQRALVRYLHRGGRLVCWPAPPDRDEWLQPCRILADVIDAPVAGTENTDGLRADLLGVSDVPLWRGVRSFRLRRGDVAIATAGGQVCGYRRRVGAGTAVVLGGWLAADSVIGRGGEVFESAPIPEVVGAAFGALAPEVLAVLGDQTVPDAAATEGIVYAYTNQRRGGEVVSGGVLAYFDGERAVGMVEVNTTTEAFGVTRFPYHPVLPVHCRAIRRLVGRPPRARVSDPHVQARVLDGPAGIGGPSTVVLVNRWPDPASAQVRVDAAGREVRMSVRMPGSTGLACPVEWPLPHGWTLQQATASLTGVSGHRGLRLRFFAPAGGMAVLRRAGVRRRVRLHPGEHWVAVG
ncbi:MAG TPA: beta-galactosidase [Mycobacteriales bacterium]|nr:beta-galactosidase [Mycobacteriales bacterium]